MSHCPEGNADKCPEYNCRKTGRCYQRRQSLAQDWRCTLCGERSQDCKGHLWGGKIVVAPTQQLCLYPPQT